eukprot:6753510-Pyramimonas_sp.AAC.1
MQLTGSVNGDRVPCCTPDGLNADTCQELYATWEDWARKKQLETDAGNNDVMDVGVIVSGSGGPSYNTTYYTCGWDAQRWVDEDGNWWPDDGHWQSGTERDNDDLGAVARGRWT